MWITGLVLYNESPNSKEIEILQTVVRLTQLGRLAKDDCDLRIRRIARERCRVWKSSMMYQDILSEIGVSCQTEH